MQDSPLKKIISCVALLVLCFLVGSLLAESYVASAGVIAVLVGSLFMLIMGSRAWILIFFLPPLLNILPLDALRGLITAYIVSAGVLVYWCLLWSIGQVKFCWRSLFVMDVLVLMMAALMVASYVRHPVAILALGIEFDMVGGAAYVHAIFAVLFYLAMSVIPMRLESLLKVLKWAIPLIVVMTFVSVLASFAGIKGNVEMEDGLADAVSDARFTAFLGVGWSCVYYIYARYPLLKIIFSPILLGGLVMSVAAYMLSGFRSRMVIMGLNVAAMAFVKKELSVFIFLALAGYAGLLTLSAGGVVKSLPHGIQRSMAILPGIEVTPEVRREAEGSTDWRIVMWEWAMDPRTGYIRDYMWGDGFGQSLSEMKRQSRAVLRGESIAGDQENYAARGTWHSGWITAIHRLGIVGLVAVSIFFLYTTIMTYRMGFALRNTPLFFPALYFVFPYAFAFLEFYVSAGTLSTFFKLFVYIGYMKLFYCEGRKAGWIKPWSWRKQYVPHMIKEHGERLQPIQ